MTSAAAIFPSSLASSIKSSSAKAVSNSLAGAAVASGSAAGASFASALSQSKPRRRAREYQRIAVRCGCWLEHEEATVFGTTVDLGRGGLFLRTALPMPPGISVRVTLRLPGQETVVADGKIVRTVAPHAGDRPGLGVRFDLLPNGDDQLCAFLFGSLREQQQEAAVAASTDALELDALELGATESRGLELGSADSSRVG